MVSIATVRAAEADVDLAMKIPWEVRGFYLASFPQGCIS